MSAYIDRSYLLGDDFVFLGDRGLLLFEGFVFLLVLVLHLRKMRETMGNVLQFAGAYRSCKSSRV